jgi:hypothetical protein
LNAGGTVSGVHLSTTGKIFLGPTYDGFNNVITATSTNMDIVGPGAFPNRQINLIDKAVAYNMVVNNTLNVYGITSLTSSRIVETGDNVALFIGDNNYYDGTQAYGMVSLTRPSNTYSRPHIAFIRSGSFVLQMGYLSGVNTFGVFTTNYALGAATPVICYSGQNVGINTRDPIYNLDVTGTARITGNVTAGSYSNTSDYRIKENVVDLKETDYTVDQLRPVHYFNNRSNKEDIGFIAHELQETYPFLVAGEKDGKEMQTVNYIGLIGVLVKEVQQLKKTVEHQKTTIETLENTNKTLETTVNDHTSFIAVMQQQYQEVSRLLQKMKKYGELP